MRQGRTCRLSVPLRGPATCSSRPGDLVRPARYVRPFRQSRADRTSPLPREQLVERLPLGVPKSFLGHRKLRGKPRPIPHCQGGWWGSVDVRRCPLLQVNARYGRQGIPADDRERHGLATTVAPRGGRLNRSPGENRSGNVVFTVGRSSVHNRLESRPLLPMCPGSLSRPSPDRPRREPAPTDTTEESP